MEQEFFLCDCKSLEHHFVINGYEEVINDVKVKEIIITPYLYNYNSIFKRIIIAFKYIFGYNSKYGHWDCIILNESDSMKLSSKIYNFLKE
jgi:hypothetical protein